MTDPELQPDPASKRHLWRWLEWMRPIEHRLGIRSTWTGITAALTGLATAVASQELPHGLTTALSITITACGIIAVMVPAGETST